MEVLLHTLNAIHPLSEGCLDRLRTILKEKQLEKKAFVLKAGHICQSIHFVEKGLLRCFYHKGDQEVSSWFMKEGDVMVSVESFFQQVVSYESIQALEPCTLWYVHYKELQQLYRDFPEFNYIARVLTEHYYCLSEQRLFSMRMQRGQERYDYLRAQDPNLIQRVPGKYLASYLGLTEVTLSKIKGRK